MTTLTHSNPTKSPTVVAIHEAGARLTAGSLRRLREGLFRLDLQLVTDVIQGGIDGPRVTVLSHCARAFEAVETLQAGTRER